MIGKNENKRTDLDLFRLTKAVPLDCHKALLDGRLDRFSESFIQSLSIRDPLLQLGSPLVPGNPYQDILQSAGTSRAADNSSKKQLQHLDLKSRKQKLSKWFQDTATTNATRKQRLCDLLLVLDQLSCPRKKESAESWLCLMKQSMTQLADLVESCDAPPEGSGLLAWIYRHGEVPWVFSMLFPELKLSRYLRSCSRKKLIQGLRILTDRHGVPRPGYVPELMEMVLSFARCLWLATLHDTRVFPVRMASRWSALLLHVLRLSWEVRDSRLCPGQELVKEQSCRSHKKAQKNKSNSTTLSVSFLETTIERTATPELKSTLRILKNGQYGTEVVPPVSVPSPSLCSNVSKMALLRPKWSSTETQLRVRFDRDPCELEWLCRGVPVLSGPWGGRICANGKEISLASQFESVCWVHDDDNLMFLELQQRLDNGIAIERQVVMACDAQFLLLSDVVKAPKGLDLTYESDVSLCSDWSFSAARDSRLAWIRNSSRQGICVMPLSLPQWKTVRSRGELSANQNRVSLKLKEGQQRLYAPVLWSWRDDLSSLDMTWSPLTVTENRRKVTSETAVGYRIQCTREDQYLVYRSLSRRGVRALLGYQTNHEFVVGQFGSDGEVTPWLRVD